MRSFIELVKEKFYKTVEKENLLNEKILIKSRVLTPEEAIGNPDRRDFPLLKGKERIMEAKFKNSVGHVFTDMPGNYEDTLSNILKKEVKNNFHRAILIVSINAVMRELGRISGTIHCKNNEPEFCARDVVKYLKENFNGKGKVALIGYQPSFIDNLSREFELKVLDLNPENFGQKYGAQVFNSEEFLDEVLNYSEIILCTGTVFVNNTIEDIARLKDINNIIFYGVTVSGIAELLNLKRVCYYSK